MGRRTWISHLDPEKQAQQRFVHLLLGGCPEVNRTHPPWLVVLYLSVGFVYESVAFRLVVILLCPCTHESSCHPPPCQRSPRVSLYELRRVPTRPELVAVEVIP